MSDMLIAFYSRVTGCVDSGRADDTMCFDPTWVFATALILSKGSYGRKKMVSLLPYGWCKESVLLTLQALLWYVVKLRQALGRGLQRWTSWLGSVYLSAL